MSPHRPVYLVRGGSNSLVVGAQVYLGGTSPWRVTGIHQAAKPAPWMADPWPEELACCVALPDKLWLYPFCVPSRILDGTADILRCVSVITRDYRSTARLAVLARLLRAGYDPCEVNEALSLTPHPIAQVNALTGFLPGELAELSRRVHYTRDPGGEPVAPVVTVGGLYRRDTDAR